MNASAGHREEERNNMDIMTVLLVLMIDGLEAPSSLVEVYMDMLLHLLVSTVLG